MQHPATGPRAADRTLVAVRAIVPVTQMPPNRAEAMFATPCATSSQFDRCRRPLMESATTADSRLSIAPSSANASASGSTAISLSIEIAGSSGAGSALGMPPNRVPIVSTGRPRTQLATGRQPDRDQQRRPVRPVSAQAQDHADRDQRHDSRRDVERRQRLRQGGQLGNDRPRLLPLQVRPSNSLSWLAKMMTAMPAVNPTVTG